MPQEPSWPRPLIETAYILLNVAWWIIIVQAVLSWLIAFNVINTATTIIRSIWIALDKLTEPMYRPIRKIMRIWARSTCRRWSC